MSQNSNIDTYVAKLLSGQNLFITGAAGVGKSYTTNAIVAAFEAKGKNVVKLASTAMAATHIGGQTLHSFLELRLYKSAIELADTRHYRIPAKLKKILKQTDLIVIDEISMVSAGILDLVSLRLLQAHYRKAVLVVGDFLQLSPVVRESDKRDYCQQFSIENPNEIFGYAFESQSWKEFAFETVLLTTVYRTKDSDFMLLLDDVRRGIFGAPHANYLQAMYEKPIPDAMDFTFLFATNDEALRHNQTMLARIDTPEERLEALYDADATPKAEIEKFCKESKIPTQFIVKVGADILFTKNSRNFFNGERGRIRSIDHEKGIVRVEKEGGIIVRVERERFEKRGYELETVDGVESRVERVYFGVMQFPFTLAYAITIHKAQGMGIEDLVIDTHRIFAPSQFYVALSRAISPQRLILQGDPARLGRLVFVEKQALAFYRALGMA